MAVESHDDFVSVQEAADAVGVHYMTAYRWIRNGDLPAFKVGGRIRIGRAELFEFVATRRVDVAVAAQPGAGRTAWSRHLDAVHQLLREGRGEEVKSLARKLILDGATASEIYALLLAPALHRVGQDWESGTLTISGEHRATAIVAGVVANLSEGFRRRGPSRGRAVTMTMAGDRHVLAANMVRDHARVAGYEIHHLGADVPADDLARFLEHSPVDVVLVSVTTPPESAVSYHHIVRAAGGAQVMFGGQSADPASIADAGGVYVADLTELMQRLRDRAAPPPRASESTEDLPR